MREPFSGCRRTVRAEVWRLPPVSDVDRWVLDGGSQGGTEDVGAGVGRAKEGL